MRWWRRKRLMLVTGASGFLGRHVLRMTAPAGWEVVAPPSSALDLHDGESVVDEIRSWRPQAVVHLAYRQDDRRLIVDGSRSVATGAALVRARLVHLSTDVVFAGRDAPYTEDDVPDAPAGYGAWKAEAERVVAVACPSAVLVRTSLLYGTALLGRSQTDVADALAGRSAMRFFTDEYRCPVHADDVAAAVVSLASMGEVSGPLHVAGPQVMSRADFARALAARSGVDPAQVPTCTRAEAGVTRPGTVLLDSSRAASLGLRCRSLAEALGR